MSTLPDAAAESDRDALSGLCLEALLTTSDSEGKSPSEGTPPTLPNAEIREQPAQRTELSEREQRLLDRAVDLLVYSHRGDAHAALLSLDGAPPSSRRLSPNTLPSVGALMQGSARPSFGPVVSEKQLLDSSRFGVTLEAPDRYELHEELGRGGLGCVQVGFDVHIGREVAIKSLLSQEDTEEVVPFDSSHMSSRFLREARLTAQLEHPSIVPIHEVGRRRDGTLYYTMRLVRGRTMAAAIQSCETLDGRLRLLHHFADLCGAVAFAHSRGVMHRDLKPQNVMIGEYSETVLIDWGLAKVKSEKENRDFERKMETLRHASLGMPIQGAALGTPEYMPPEQAFGDILNIDEPSDVYSLGAILYNLLTGRAPFEGRGPLEVLRKVQRYGQGKETLVPVLQRVPGAPPELAAVVEKALHAHPAKRYQTAGELLDEVDAFREGRKVGAYNYSRSELFKRFLRKRRAISTMAAVFVLILFGVLLMLSHAWQGERQANRRIQWDMSEAFVEKAASLSLNNDLLGARVYAAAALRDSRYNKNGRDPDSNAVNSKESQIPMASLMSTLWRAEHLGIAGFRTSIGNADTPIDIVAFSPDGTYLATEGTDCVVRVWNAQTGSEVASHPGSHCASSLAWAPDGKTLAFAEDEKVMLWRVADTAKPVPISGHEGDVTAITYSPDGKLLASASKDWSVCVWDVATRTCAVKLKSLDDESFPETLAFTADGLRVVSAGQSRNVLLWDVAEGRLIERRVGHEDGVSVVKAAPDGSIWLLDNDHTVLRWDPAQRKEEPLVLLGGSRPSAFGASFVGKPVIAVGRAHGVELWDPQSGRKLEMLRGHDKQVRAVAFDPSGKVLATTGQDGRINLWDVGTYPKRPHVPCGNEVATTISLSPDGGQLAVGERNGSIFIWDIIAAKTVSKWHAHDSAVAFIAHAPNSTIVSAARDGTVRRWSANGASQLGEIKAFKQGTTTNVGFALSPNGEFLAAGSAGFDINLWSLGDGSVRRSFVGHRDRVSSLVFSPDGSTLASGADDKTIRFWNVESGQIQREIQVSDSIGTVAWSPDGQWIAASDKSLTVGLFRAIDGKEVGRFGPRQHGMARRLAFSKDSSLLATADASDMTVNIWSVPGGVLQRTATMPEIARVATFLSHQRETLAITSCSDIVFVPFGTSVVETNPETLLEEAQRRAGMRLERFDLVPYAPTH